jgi:hypothetical protein
MLLPTQPDSFCDKLTSNDRKRVENSRGPMGFVDDFEAAICAFEKFGHDEIRFQESQ